MNALKRLPWLYLLIAYSWAWLLWIPVALTRTDYRASPLLVAVLLLGVFGPGLAAILLTWRDRDPGQRADFWKRLLDLKRIRMRWLILMLVAWPALHVATNEIALRAGQPAPTSGLVAQIAAQPAFALVVTALYFLQAALEDIGWRGYMGERLLRFFSPGAAALIVGLFHGVWHLPLFFVMGTNQATMGLGLPFGMFVAQAVAFSCYATWCYVDNGHSTMAAILLHTVGNLCNDIFTLQGGTLKFEIYTLLMVLGALGVLAWMSRRGHARGSPLSVQQAVP